MWSVHHWSIINQHVQINMSSAVPSKFYVQNATIAFPLFARCFMTPDTLMMMKTSCTAWHRKYTTYVRVVVYLLSLPWVSSCLHISWIVQVVVNISFHDHSTVTYSRTPQRHLSRTADMATSRGKISGTADSRAGDLEKLTTNFALENRSRSNSSTESLWGRCPKTRGSLISFSVTKKLSLCQIHKGIARCQDWESIEISMGSSSCDSCFSQSHLFV